MAENRPPNRPPNFQWSTSSKSTRPPNFSWWALAFCSVGRTLSGRDLLVRYTVHGRTCTLNCWGVVQPVGHRTVNAFCPTTHLVLPQKVSPNISRLPAALAVWWADFSALQKAWLTLRLHVTERKSTFGLLRFAFGVAPGHRWPHFEIKQSHEIAKRHVGQLR